MEALVIKGGKPLRGTVEISGAKNAVLPILAATMVRGGRYVLRNCPAITDVEQAAEIIRALGGRVERAGRTLYVDTAEAGGWHIPGKLMARMRASVLFLGALLARFGRASLTMPGGCPLGRRPIDLHLEAMARMGASVTMREGEILCTASRLHGGTVEFPFPSVGATENALLAATACCGTVVLRGAAREPEIADLIGFLRSMGADMEGAGTERLTIRGQAALDGTAYTILPDRIETATYLCAVAACGGEVTLNAADGSLLLPVLEALARAGCRIWQQRDRILLRSDGALQAIPALETAPYPGFPTDAQAPMMAALLRAGGESRITETVFEHRMAHVAQLRRFGADLALTGSTAAIRGVERLRPARVEGGDLRGTAALILAALQAEGESAVFGLKHLDRGYDNLEGNLRRLGASIERIDE